MPCRHFKISQAISALAASEVIAYPTEAVWGLGCDPFNEQAVRRILALKRRPEHKGLILVAGHVEQFEPILRDLSAEHRARLEETWPGPVTWLVPHHGRVPGWITGSFDTVALRVSAHPLVRALCNGFGAPLVSTSANPQGLAPARTSLRVRGYFGQAVRVVPGPLGRQQKPSEIRDLINGKIVRPG